MRTLVRCLALTVVCVLVVPGMALAQGAIAGTVRDASGAVLPGATVEVSSAALIEKARTAVTDGTGQYKITELRPGTYSVTFTLPGFSTVKRDGVELTTDFTATINAEMKVGAVQETITVTAESPVVDVQGITTRTVMTREVLDIMPTGRNIQAVGIMIPGTNLSFGGGAALSRDVGGSGTLQQSPLNYRGSADAVQTVDGMRLNNLEANGAYSGVYWNDGSWQEISYVTGADSAEMAQGGIRINMVPKDGGNNIRGVVFGSYAGSGWDANNLRDNLRGDFTFNAPNPATGKIGNQLTNVSRVEKIWDFNPSVGGPIVKDRLWWYATFRHWGAEKTVPDSYFNALGPTATTYQPDLNNLGIDDGHIVSVPAGRVTAQLSSKDKIAYYHDNQRKYRDHWGISALVPPEATAIQVTPTSFVSVTKWTRTQTSRLLLEAGFAVYDQEYTELYQPSVTGITDKVWDPAAIEASKVYAIQEQSNLRWVSAWNSPADHFSVLRTYSGSASYVTGAHAFKFGGALSEGPRRTVEQYTGDLTLQYNNSLPSNVIFRTRRDQREAIKADVGLYAQDRWTIKRATINAGLRFDWYQGEVLDEDLPAGRWNPALHTEGFDVNNWKDLNPRLGVSYDLFGSGKTALKVSAARYVNGENVVTAADINPQNSISRSDTRAWNDQNLALGGNRDLQIFNPDGSLQSAEIGASLNPNFGKAVVSTTYDPALLEGWHVRQYNWEYSASIQHELLPRVSVSAGWYRRSYGNQTTIDDLNTSQSSYDGPFCITAPVDPNLPGGGGYPVCGLYDIKPSAALLPIQNVRTLADNFGGIIDVFNGFDFGVNARLRGGTLVQGGIGAVRRHYDTCNAPLQAATRGVTAVVFTAPTSTVDNPQKQFCDQTFPYRPDVKAFASHPLPWDVIISGTYQFSRGVQNPFQPSIVADWPVTNAIIAAPTALGRNLAGGGQTKTVRLIEPGTVYSTEFGGVNLNQLDLRLSKMFRFNRYRFRIDADLYNTFNSNWPFTLNTTFSSSTTTSAWLRPTNVLQGRFFKIGAHFDF
jgi:Carboxypeptidase regulatory-like domain